jgi:orotate phosphoribosyltransferase
MLSVALSAGKISPEDKTYIDNWLSDLTKGFSPIKRETIQTYDESKDEVADILINTGAVSFVVDSPYKFSSGLLSPIYLDARRLISFPTEWERILFFFEKVIIDLISIQQTNVIAGIAMGGIPHAARLTTKFGIPMTYVKSSPAEYGKRTRIEGRIEVGNRIVTIEDVVTTGRSVISGVTVLRDAGGVVKNCLAIMTYEMQDAKDSFEKAGLSLVALTNLTSLVRVAKRRGILSDSQAMAISTWQKNPWNWTQLRLSGDFQKFST